MKAVLLSIVANIFFVFPCTAQSVVGVTFGIDFANVAEYNNVPNWWYFDIHENQYSARSYFFGIKGEKYLSEINSISLSLNYTQKKTEASTAFNTPTELIKFKQYRSSLAFKSFVVPRFQVGIGISLNYLANVRAVFQGGDEYPLEIKNKKELGGIITVGYMYNNILMEMYFNKSFTPHRKDSPDFKPINSFGLSLSYLLQVGKGRR